MKRYLVLLVSIISFSAGANTYEKAIDYAINNKSDSALVILRKLEANNTNSKASLLACLLESQQQHYATAYEHFKKFYEHAENPQPYFYALATSGIFNKGTFRNTDDVERFLGTVIDDSKSNMTVRAAATERLANILFLRNKIKKSDEVYLKLCDVKNWSSVGVFENVSGSGFNKSFGVLEHPESDYVFTNKVGAKVKWFKIYGRNDRWWDFEHSYVTTDAIIYAQTFLESAEDKEVYLTVGVSGSMKVWVNDFLVGVESEERNTDLDMYVYKVKLNKGYNRVLIQIGSSDIERSNYLVRIADMNMNLISNVNTSAEYRPYKKAEPYEVVQKTFFAEEYFEEREASGKTDFVDELVMMDIYNHGDKKYKARNMAARLKKKYPGSTLVSEKYIEALRRDNNNIDLRKEVAFIKNNDPESNIGMLLRYNEVVERDNWDSAQVLLNRYVALYGESEDVEEKRIDLLVGKNDVDALLKEVDSAYKKYPDYYTFLVNKYTASLKMSMDLNEANQLLIDYMKNNYNISIREEIIKNYLKLGKKDEAIKLSKQIVEELPYASKYYYDIASTLYDLKLYDDAISYMDKALERAPYIGFLHFAKAQILEAKDMKKEATEMVRHCIEFDPCNYTARKKLRVLEGKKDLYEFLKQDDAEFIYRMALNENKDVKDNAVFLLDDTRLIIYPENGASEEKTELLVHVLNQTAINEYKEISVPYNSYTQRLIVEKAELLKPDGSIVNADRNDNYFVFSSLEMNDAIHLVYRIENSREGYMAEHFFKEHTFNGSYPVKTSRLSLIVPKEKKLQYRTYHTDLKAKVDTVDNYLVYVWEQNDNKGVSGEPLMPAYSDVAQRVVVTTIPDWDYIAKWYSDISSVKAKANFEVKAKVKELFGDKMPASDLEKARIIYNYIVENINYSNVSFLHGAFIPQSASTTISSRLGDCKDLATLFVALAREVGLDASLVLVNTRDNGSTMDDLPTIDFNHCIARLDIKGKRYYVELTDNYLPFSALGHSLVYAKVLHIPVKEGKGNKVNQITFENNDGVKNYIYRSNNVRFDGSNAVIDRSVYKVGAPASSLRASYKDKNNDERILSLAQSISSDFNKNIKVDSLDFRNLSNLQDTLFYDYKVSVDNFTSTLIGMQVFRLPWTDTYYSSDWVTASKRNFPFELWELSSVPVVEEEVVVNLPKGKKLVEIPKDVSFSCPEMSCKVSYSVKGDKLIAKREVRFLKDRVETTSYKEFKDFIIRFNEEHEKQFAFK